MNTIRDPDQLGVKECIAGRKVKDGARQLAAKIAEYLQEIFCSPEKDPQLEQTEVKEDKGVFGITLSNVTRSYTVIVHAKPDGNHDWNIEGGEFAPAGNAIRQYVYDRLNGVGIHVNKLGQYFDGRASYPK